MNYDFAELHRQLERAGDLFMAGHKQEARMLGLTDEEMVALFQHFIDTDTLPTAIEYELTAGDLYARGKIHHKDAPK